MDSDNSNTSALHYAVSNNCFHLVRLLILEGLNVNQINNEGHSPLSLYLKTRSGLVVDFMGNGIGPLQTVYSLLA